MDPTTKAVKQTAILRASLGRPTPPGVDLNMGDPFHEVVPSLAPWVKSDVLCPMTSDWPLTWLIANVNVYSTVATPPRKREEVRNAPRWAARGRPRPSLDVEQGGPRFDGLDLDRRHRLRCYVKDDNRTPVSYTHLTLPTIYSV